MRNTLICFRTITLCLLLSYARIDLHGQESLLSLEKEFLLKSTWQEYMPDAYALDDGTILMVGLNTDMSTLTVNMFLRWITLDGNILRETEVFHITNDNGNSFALETFFSGSAVDEDYVYVIAAARDSCVFTMENYRSYRFLKVDLGTGDVVKDTAMCFEGIWVFSDISTSSLEDTLYAYGSLGYVNQNPDIILTTMSKDFRVVNHEVLKTTDTHLIPLGVIGDSRAIAGSHYRYLADYSHVDRQDIWYGRIEGDSVVVKGLFDYYERNVLWKSFFLDDHEKAFLGYGINTGFESSICLLRDDTVAWCFYDYFFQEFSDLIRIEDNYCILQASYREDDNRIDKIVLRYLDKEGFETGSDSFIARWIRWSHGGLRIGDTYFAFIYITDLDELQAVNDGTLALEDARIDYTHVFKFRINE